MQAFQKQDFFRRVLALVALTVCLGTAPAVRAAGPEATPETHTGTELVLRAMSLLGVNYKLGGSSPDTGLDCSGMVRHVFRETVGMVLPRRAEDISKAGTTIETSQLRPGDLVFFNTLRRTFSHVGIYIGNGQFVHAATRGGGVKVEQMSAAYWSQRFNGARRVVAESLGFDRPPAAARALPQPGGSPVPAGQLLPLTGTVLPRTGPGEFGVSALPYTHSTHQNASGRRSPLTDPGL